VLFKLAQRHIDGPEGAITDYLDDVYHRVRKRLADANRPTKPPKGWREELRPVLQDELRRRREAQSLG
jgi:hypothetical protein